MPPPKKSKVQDSEREELTQALGKMILEARERAYAQNGRSVSRRINRFEYENVLRDLLHDPYLKIAGQLPLDGEVHGFAKVGTALAKVCTALACGHCPWQSGHWVCQESQHCTACLHSTACLHCVSRESQHFPPHKTDLF